MIAGKGSEINSKVLSDMREFPLSAVICSEAAAFADKIISLSTPSSCDKTVQDNGNGTVASKLTPVENSTSVIIETLLSSQEDSVTVVPETPCGSQQQQEEQQQQPPLVQQEDSTQPVLAGSTSPAGAVGSLAMMTMEALNIPSHIDSAMLHHSVCVLVSLLFRFPVYFKPLYRLAWLFYKLKAFQVNQRCMNHLFVATYTTLCSLLKCVYWDHFRPNFNKGRFYLCLFLSQMSLR